MEERLRRRLLRTLDGALGPDEELLVGSNGMHPKLAAGTGTFVSIVIGVLAGSTIQSATSLGPASLAPFAGAMVALMARWIYVFRTSSDRQFAGAMPLIGLTGERLIFIGTDFWGRPTGGRHEFPIPRISEITVKKRLLGLPDTTIRTEDDRLAHYQIRYAERIKTEIDRLQAE